MKSLILMLLAVVLSFSLQAQETAGGVYFSSPVNLGGEKLQLNGVGIRTKFFMDMYAGALYLESKSANADAIINASKPMALKLHILNRLITSEKMIAAVDEGFENAAGGKTTALAAEIEKFKSYFQDPISKNDVFDIVYVPAKGVMVYKNNEHRGTIKGMDFKKALFGIWLSEKPADKNLKLALLGKK